MRLCESCGRDFAGRRADCPFCGFNTAPKGGPRSKRSLAEMERQRQEREQFEGELSGLSEEFAAWLGGAEAVEQEQTEGSLA